MLKRKCRECSKILPATHYFYHPKCRPDPDAAILTSKETAKVNSMNIEAKFKHLQWRKVLHEKIK